MKPIHRLLGEQQFVVEPRHAIDFATGGMPAVLSTPWLIWFLEHAAREAVLPSLEPGESTVANIGRSMKNEEMFIAARAYFGDGAETAATASAPPAPIVTRCGVTVTPGCTRCDPFTTITSPGFRPSRTMRNPSITRPSFT